MRAVLCTAFEGIKSLTIGETEQPQARSQVPHRARSGLAAGNPKLPREGLRRRLPGRSA